MLYVLSLVVFNIGIKYLDLELPVDRIFPRLPEITILYESAHLSPNSLV